MPYRVTVPILIATVALVACTATTEPVNERPSVSITAPTSGTTVTVGESVTFTASATDTEDGNLSAAIAWSSDIDGALGSGASVTATLSLGTHVVEANVTDASGATATASVTVTVEPNQPPTVTISAPTSGTTVTEGESVTFTASAADAEDGDLTTAIVWSSDIDGALGSGASVAATLTAGSHVVEASVADAHGAADTASVTVTVETNEAPTVSISAPASDTTVTIGESVTFTASAADAEDGDLTAAIVWSSDIDGALGSGASVAATLTLGSHVVEARVVDADGAADTASIVVTVDVVRPETVTDVTVVAVTGSSATITWTEVLDGFGSPAEYEVRFAATPIGAGPGDLPTQGTCTGVIPGTSAGAVVQCDVEGLLVGNGYDFVVTATRPVVGGPRVYGTPSDPATGYTDFFEDFSAFGDDVVPTAPHGGLEYYTTDGTSEGQLTDRPLILSKAGSDLAGSSNFSISRPGFAPLVETDTGLIHLSVDIQVNSGSFCQFLAIRGTAFNSVSSVYLHDLSYTPGVAYRMIMTMDVDAGTISATQDGAPVTVSRTNFPYMPIRFGLESCSREAQESAADNFRIEHRWP
jgi:hypothetical protein